MVAAVGQSLPSLDARAQAFWWWCMGAWTQWGFPGGSVGQNLPANAGDLSSIPGSRRTPGEWQPTPAFFPGKSHGQRSLADYSSWGCKELDMT